MIKGRVFSMTQYLKNTKTGDELYSEKQIIEALEKHPPEKYVYILHDKDIIDESDVIEYREKHGVEPPYKVGDLKPAHFHIVVKYNGAKSIENMSKWFGIPEFLIQKPRGRGNFDDCVSYLFHSSEKQKQKGKTEYSYSEAKANFDVEKYLEEIKTIKEKYGKYLSEAERMRYDVAFHGKTIKECKEENPNLYLKIRDKLEKDRKDYLSNCEVPKYRINIYMDGAGGNGKGISSKSLARVFFPELSDEELFFEASHNGKVTFDGYDGEPVIIWNDFRADELLSNNGRGTIFDMFDPFPSKKSAYQNVKYGKIRLLNKVNIINSVQPFNKFFETLCGEFKDEHGNSKSIEDKTQAYRRFPFLITVHPDCYDFFVNKKILDNEASYFDYKAYLGIPADFRKIINSLSYDEELKKEFESKTLKIVKEEFNRYVSQLKENQMTKEEAEKEFQNFGEFNKDETLEISMLSYKEKVKYDSKEKLEKEVIKLNEEKESYIKENFNLMDELEEKNKIIEQLLEENNKYEKRILDLTDDISEICPFDLDM